MRVLVRGDIDLSTTLDDYVELLQGIVESNKNGNNDENHDLDKKSIQMVAKLMKNVIELKKYKFDDPIVGKLDKILELVYDLAQQ